MKNTNELVGPMLTDLYQLTMAYAYWKNGRQDEEAVFDLFFRSNPFNGEYTVYAGLEEILRLLENFKFTDRQIKYLREGMFMTREEQEENFLQMLESGVIRQVGQKYFVSRYAPGNGEEYQAEIDYPTEDNFIESPLADCEPEFFDWLRKTDCSKIKVWAIPEGTFVFPRIPLLRVKGPLAIAQMLETPMLNLTNYPTLETTNASRYRLAAGFDKKLLELGLRRAQGPDGAISASRYSYMGGFDGTSNVLAGMLFGIFVGGTQAHSYISSYTGLHELKFRMLKSLIDGKEYDFVDLVLEWRKVLGFQHTNDGELAAFISYALAFPKKFLALVDTYDTLKSGVPNFICVAMALKQLGYNPIGIRLDSGDLAFLSKETRKLFIKTSQLGMDISKCTITASNDISESILLALKQEGHEIDTFGIGTNLVTCSEQPALGGVYKLVSINGIPRIKLSQQRNKITIPGEKEAYRIYVQDEIFPTLDLLVQSGSTIPKVGEKILCRHPFNEADRLLVTPTKVIKLHLLVWDGKRVYAEIPLKETREFVIYQQKNFREDHLRPINPTPYFVSVTEELYQFIHELWLREAPIKEL